MGEPNEEMKAILDNCKKHKRPIYSQQGKLYYATLGFDELSLLRNRSAPESILLLTEEEIVS